MIRLSGIWILIVLLMAGCSSSRTGTKKQTAQMDLAPEWVKERPISSQYYIGIAKVNKQNYPDNYRDIAKRKALNDLASEISVNIQSSSIASSSEDQSGFRSDYSNYIQMEMTKDLSGYELVDSYETDDFYMVYYHLSKARWKEIQAERKNAAADKSYTSYMRGQKEEAELNYPAAIKSYLNALLELKKYWNEAVYYDIDGKKERLDLTIRQSLTALLSEIKLRVQPEKIVLSVENNYHSEVLLEVVNSKEEGLKNFPVTVSYRKKDMPYQTTLYTDRYPISLKIKSLLYKKEGTFVSVEIDKDALLPIKAEDKNILKFVDDAFNVKAVKIQVDYLLPSIYIQSRKSSPESHYIIDAIKQELNSRSFHLVENKKQADIILNVKIYSSSGQNESKVKTAFVSYTAEFVKKSNGQLVSNFTSPKYKGVSYEYADAKEKAYMKAGEEIKESNFKTVFEELLH